MNVIRTKRDFTIFHETTSKMRKLTGSLNSGADVECLGTGYLLEGADWCKWRGKESTCQFQYCL